MRLWTLKNDKVAEGEEVRILEGHTGNVHAVSFSKEGMMVCNDMKQQDCSVLQGFFAVLLTNLGRVRVAVLYRDTLVVLLYVEIL